VSAIERDGGGTANPSAIEEMSNKLPGERRYLSDNEFNSTFGAVEEQRRRMGKPSVKIHPEDAGRRGIAAGDLVRVFNERGECQYYAEVTDDTREGVVVAEGLWWSKHTPDEHSVNTLISTRLTDLGAGSTFQCNLIEVKRP